MTYLARRFPARGNTNTVRVEAITRVDRDYQVEVYGNMSILWNNLERHRAVLRHLRR